MSGNKNSVKLYNVLFPLWLILLFPQAWLVVIPGNFIIDSLVLIINACALKLADKKQWYKRHIVKIYLFGMLSDFVGAAFLFVTTLYFELGQMGDELYLTLPALVISAILIFIFNYFITFKRDDRGIRLKSALIFALATAPYTFLIPTSWLYA